MAIDIHQVPNAPPGYSLANKRVMVHNLSAPPGTETVKVLATDLATGTPTGSYLAPMWKEADGDMTAGLTTFQHNSLIGASEMNFIIVNKVIEFIDEDYTFNDVSGTITRNNIWFAGDKMVTPHKPG